VIITIIHGQSHKGSTYHIARMVADKLDGSVDEYFLPQDFDRMCLGCFACLNRGREHCPHHDLVGPILDAMLTADVLIIGSPTYVLEMTGQLKCLFDHLFTAWLSHRPEKAMFTKTAVVVSTAAGAGMNGVARSLARQLFYLGVPKVYRIAERVAASSWTEVKRKKPIAAKAAKVARRITARQGRAVPGLKLRFMFAVMRAMHKNNDWAPLDKQHWQSNGWFGRARPWKG